PSAAAAHPRPAAAIAGRCAVGICQELPSVARLGIPDTAYPVTAGRRPRRGAARASATGPPRGRARKNRRGGGGGGAAGTPAPESSAVRAHVPACFWFFARSWAEIFRHGVCDHQIKELCRVYISRSVNCEYCGNQRSVQAAAQGLTEGKYDELLNFEKSD